MYEKNMLYGTDHLVLNDHVGIQLGGHITNYEPYGMSFVTLHGAGHLVPQSRPQAAYHMISKFLSTTTTLMSRSMTVHCNVELSSSSDTPLFQDELGSPLLSSQQSCVSTETRRGSTATTRTHRPKYFFPLSPLLPCNATLLAINNTNSLQAILRHWTKLAKSVVYADII
jgi:Serine carboxypeptidase